MTQLSIDLSNNEPDATFRHKVDANFTDLYTQVTALNTGGGNAPNVQTGATYHFVIGDANKLVQGNKSTSQTFTVDPNATTAFAIGTKIEVEQIGAGVVTIAAGAGVTIDSAEGLVFEAQYQRGTLIKSATNTWEFTLSAPGAISASAITAMANANDSAGGLQAYGQPNGLIAAGPAGAITTITNQQTPTTGGVTLPSQVAAAASMWRVKAWGTYAAQSSGTARNFEATPFWGTQALTKIACTVLASQAQTTGWDAEFILQGVDTTHIWTSGRVINNLDSTTESAANSIDLATAASVAVTAGAQTIDLRFDTSASVTSEAITVQGVTIERLV